MLLIASKKQKNHQKRGFYSGFPWFSTISADRTGLQCCRGVACQHLDHCSIRSDASIIEITFLVAAPKNILRLNHTPLFILTQDYFPDRKNTQNQAIELLKKLSHVPSPCIRLGLNRESSVIGNLLLQACKDLLDNKHNRAGRKFFN